MNVIPQKEEGVVHFFFFYQGTRTWESTKKRYSLYKPLKHFLSKGLCKPALRKGVVYRIQIPATYTIIYLWEAR